MRRSLSNPSLRTERRTTLISKMRVSSSIEASQIPRPRIRSLSSDRLSGRKSNLLRQPGKPSLGQYVPTTPKTPSYPRPNLGQMSTNRPGPSPSAERASMLVAKAPRKDTRPITDKLHQSQMLKKIDNYFYSIQQTSMLNSSGSIKPITIKMFVEVSKLLIELLGMKLPLTNLNYVEEIPKVSKKLQYPGPMSKAWLKTANAMHAWPNVLAWLSWLVEMCEMREIAMEQLKIENLPFSNSDRQAEKHKTMFFAMLNFYNAWNEENLDLEERLVSEYLKSEEARLGVSEDAFEIARSDCEAVMQKLAEEDALRAKVDQETKELEATLCALEEDKRRIREYIYEQDKHIKTIKTEIQQVKCDCCVLDEEINKQHVKQEELKIIIKKQPISPAERDEIVAKCEDVRKYLNQFEEHLQGIQKDVYSQDLKLSAITHNLNKIILEYNRDIHNHLDNISGVDVDKIQIPEKVVSDSNSLDVLHEISVALTKLKEKMKEELEEVEALIKPNMTKLEHLQDKVKILANDNQELEKKSNENNVKLKKIKKQAQVQEEELRANIKSLEQSIKLVQDSLPDLKSLRTVSNEKIDKRDSVKRRKEYLEQRATNFFDKMFSIFANHREECSEILDKLKKT